VLRDLASHRLALTLLAGAALGAAPARAQVKEETAIEVKDPVVRAELDLFVNGARAGIAFVEIERGDVRVRASDLERFGIPTEGAAAVTVAGEQRLSLRSLAPTVTYELDERALALRLTVPAERLGRHLLDLRPRFAPAGMELRSDASAFLDYAAYGDLEGRGGASLSGGGRAGDWLATTSFNWSTASGWARGLTSAVRDDVPGLTRWTVGDAVATSGPLGGSAVLGGVAFGREFSLDPYLLRGPLPATSALVGSPSTLELYVNGTMVRQQPLAPGYWDVANIPVIAGDTRVRAVVRDAFGKETVVQNDFYFSAGLLAAGLSDYSVAAGFLRGAFGEESFSYGDPAALGRYRWGFSDQLTPGLRAEASTGLAAAGGTLTAGTPWGELEGAIAGSVADGLPGAAARLAWRWSSREYSFAMRLGAQSDHAAHLALDPATDRAVLEAELGGGVAFGSRYGFSGEVRGGRYRDAGSYGAVGLRGSVQLGAGASLSIFADYGKRQTGESGLELMALLSWGFARGYSADVGTARDGSGNLRGTLGAARAMPRDSGWGYRVRTSADESDASFEGLAQGQTSFGRAELRLGRMDGTTTLQANGSGGIVVIDGRPFLSRATDGGFALVEAGGVGGVTVTREGGVVGRTGEDGKLLVTGMLPYYANRLTIHERDLPLDYEARRTERFVATALHGGAVVAFDVRKISAIQGRLVVRIAGRRERPSNGQLSVIVDGELRGSPISPEGRFFLERMPPGKHVIQAVWGGGSCRGAIALPVGAQPVHDAGEVRCILDVLDPEGKLPTLQDPAYADQPEPGEPATGAGGGGGGGGEVR
jgi:outer membrane usher protein